MIVPNATQSWQFGSTNETRNVGDTELVQESNGTSLKLTGSGYLTQNVNSTKNLSALTLSAWIKPDYSQGSPQFTVISKESTFLLAVNNVIPPTKRAIFSVFDGIKWQTVESSSSIPEEWTHLAATFNDSSIVIYVNGKLESSLQTSGVPTLAVNGTLTTKTVDSLSSNADIIIGAYLNTLRGTSTNQFSGLIKDVKLYDSLLSPSQISQLYEQNNMGANATTSNFSLNNSTLADQVSMIDAINLAINSASSQVNSTISIVPILKSDKESFLITENPQLQFQYLDNSTILENTQKTITRDLVQLDNIEGNLNKTESVLNETHSAPPITSEKINLVQQKIDEAQQQVQDAQQQIQLALVQPQDQTVVDDALKQTHEALAQ
ncbi:MAG: LamG domain-containing protein, partial [Thaumarchaeota archaeon]